MTEELRYLSMKKEAWEEIIKPAIEKHFHIEGLSGNKVYAGMVRRQGLLRH